MRKSLDSTGFRAPTHHPPGRTRRTVVLAQFVATLALALGTMIAVTVLTVGIARASAVGDVVGHETGLFGIALLFGLIFIGLGGLSGRPRKQR